MKSQNQHPHTTADDFLNLSSNNNNIQRNRNNLSKIFRNRRTITAAATKKQTKDTNRMNNAKYLMNMDVSGNGDGSGDSEMDLGVAINEKNQYSRMTAAETTPTTSPSLNFEDEQIIFTENQIYVGINEQINNNNSTQFQQNVFTKIHEKQPLNRFNGNQSNNYTQINCFAKEIDRTGDSTNRTGTANPKSVEKETIFEKVKFNRTTKSMSHSQQKASTVHLAQENANINSNRPKFQGRHLFETSADVSFENSMDSSSPTNRLSEYDNLNETFHLTHSPCYGTKNYNSNGTYAETWDFLTNKSYACNNVMLSSSQPLSHKRLLEIHYEAAVSSRRTSISTIETWIDDEIFDNSFNEELEKRCATYH